MKQIERDGKQQNVDGDGEQHHDHHVAPHRSDALGKAGGEIDGFTALVEAALASAAAAATTAILCRLLAVAAAARHRTALVFTDRPVIIVDGLDEGQVGCAFQLGIVHLCFRLRRRGGAAVLLRRHWPFLRNVTHLRFFGVWGRLRKGPGQCDLSGGRGCFRRRFRAGQVAQVFDGLVYGRNAGISQLAVFRILIQRQVQRAPDGNGFS